MIQKNDPVVINSPDSVWHGHMGIVSSVLDSDRWPVSVDFDGEPPYGQIGWAYFRYDEVEKLDV